MMNYSKDLIESVDRGGRVYDHSRFTPVRCNQTESTIEMNASLLMDGDPIRARFRERPDELIGSFNHEMTIERNLANLTERGDYRRANRNIGHEVAVHNVHMENGRSAFYRRLCFYSESGEVGRKNGGGQLDH
jgi:hypothetical protein